MGFYRFANANQVAWLCDADIRGRLVQEQVALFSIMLVMGHWEVVMTGPLT